MNCSLPEVQEIINGLEKWNSESDTYSENSDKILPQKPQKRPRLGEITPPDNNPENPNVQTNDQ